MHRKMRSYTYIPCRKMCHTEHFCVNYAGTMQKNKIDGNEKFVNLLRFLERVCKSSTQAND